MSLELLERRHLLAVTHWDGGAGDLLWNSPANWDNDQLPGPDDVVIIGDLGGEAVRAEDLNISIRSLNAAAAIEFVDVAFSATGPAEFGGSTSIRGGSLSANGALAAIRFHEAAVVSDTRLLAFSGGSIDASTLASYSAGGTGDLMQPTLHALGPDSTIRLSGLTSLVNDGEMLFVVAASGGRIELAGSLNEDGTAPVVMASSGAASEINLEQVGKIEGAVISAVAGGRIALNQGVTTLTDVQLEASLEALIVGGSLSLHGASQITVESLGRLDLSDSLLFDDPGAVHLAGGSIKIGDLDSAPADFALQVAFGDDTLYLASRDSLFDYVTPNPLAIDANGNIELGTGTFFGLAGIVEAGTATTTIATFPWTIAIFNNLSMEQGRVEFEGERLRLTIPFSATGVPIPGVTIQGEGQFVAYAELAPGQDPIDARQLDGAFTFEIDPTETSINVGGAFGLSPFTPQAPDSEKMRFGGRFKAEFSSGFVRFPGDTRIIPTAKDGLFRPGVEDQPNTLHVAPGGLLRGPVTVQGDVVNEGTLAPGGSAGVIDVRGNFTQTSFGRLEIGIEGPDEGTDFGFLDVQGTALFGGELRIHVEEGGEFDVVPGNQFDILHFGARANNFLTTTGLRLVDGLYLRPEFLADRLQLTAIEPRVDVAPTRGLQTTKAGDSAQFQVVLAAPPTHVVLVEMLSTNSSEGILSTSELQFGPGNWDQPQTVTITGIDNGLSSGDQTYRVLLSVDSLDPAYDGVFVDYVEVTNLEMVDPLRVTTTADSGPGSLREAMAYAHTQTGDVTITFAIPQTDVNFDGSVFHIAPLTPLPTFENPNVLLTLDGASQALFGGETNPAGPEIVIAGATTIAVNNSTVVIDEIALVVSLRAEAGAQVMLAGTLGDVASDRVLVESVGTGTIVMLSPAVTVEHAELVATSNGQIVWNEASPALTDAQVRASAGGLVVAESLAMFGASSRLEVSTQAAFRLDRSLTFHDGGTVTLDGGSIAIGELASAPADYALQLIDDFFTAFTAVRDTAYDVSTPAPRPITAQGEFSVSGIRIDVIRGRNDAIVFFGNTQLLRESIDASGTFFTNVATESGQLEILSDGLRLTMPFFASGNTFFDDVLGLTIGLGGIGQLVAFAPLSPDEIPSSLAQLDGEFSFAIDSGQSFVEVFGSLNEIPLEPQSAGSELIRFEGLYRTVISGSTIHFPGGSVVDPIDKPGFFRPGVDIQPNTLHVLPGGTLSGNMTIDGRVVNDALVTPGAGGSGRLRHNR